MKKIPIGNQAFAIAIAFLFGIFAANENWNMPALIGIGAMCALLFLGLSQKWKFAKCMGVLLIAAVMGCAYYSVFIYWQTSHTNIPKGKAAQFFAIIAKPPQSAGNFTMLTAALSRPYSGTVDLFVSPHVNFDYGDLVWVKGTVVPPETPGESSALFFPQVRVLVKNQGSWLTEKMINVRSYIIQRFDQVLSTDEAALLSAIVLGVTNTVSAGLKAQMEASGTSYIAGMYGYKIAIIIAFLASILRDHVSRKIVFFMTLISVWLFVAASGGGISVIRAAIMGSIVLIARISGRSFSVRNALVFTGAVMAVTNPTILTDAAFQLSFLSFLGIYYLGPSIQYFFHWRDKGMLDWKEHAMLSLSTNLAILPIVMKIFGGFSLTSFISNILIMIPWPVALVGGVFIILAGCITPYLTFLIARAMDIFLGYELFIIKIFARFTMPMPQLFNTTIAIALYYGILIIFAYYYATPPQENY